MQLSYNTKLQTPKAQAKQKSKKDPYKNKNKIGQQACHHQKITQHLREKK
jgi:ribosomal protein S30